MKNITTYAIKDLIANGRLDLAIEALSNYTLSLPNPFFHNTITQISGRWKENEQAYDLHLITNDEYDLVKNQIRKSLLSLIDEVFSLKREPSLFTELQKRKLSFSLIILGTAILVTLIGMYSLTPYYWKNLFLENPMQLTVYVQNVDGKSVHELQNIGKIIVDFGNDRRDPVIGENGRTNLGEIPVKFRGKQISIRLDAEGYELIDTNKHYIMNGEPIYLQVQRDNSLGIIKGIVTDRSGEHFIAEALVMIDHDTTTTTDSLGRFNLLMPIEKHKNTYALVVKKKGYKVKNDYYKPKTGPLEIRLNR